jgi:hypothetical protein
MYEMNVRQASPFLERDALSKRSMASILATIAFGVGMAGWGAVSALAKGPGRHPVTAIAERTISVHEYLHTDEVISHKGNTAVTERGRGMGTFSCGPVVMKITISYTNGTANMSCATSSGEMNAGGKVSFFTAGQTGTFTGTLVVLHGTGKYAHDSGRFHTEGTMMRKTFALSATLSGLLTY